MKSHVKLTIKDFLSYEAEIKSMKAAIASFEDYKGDEIDLLHQKIDELEATNSELKAQLNDFIENKQEQKPFDQLEGFECVGRKIKVVRNESGHSLEFGRKGIVIGYDPKQSDIDSNYCYMIHSDGKDMTGYWSVARVDFEIIE